MHDTLSQERQERIPSSFVQIKFRSDCSGIVLEANASDSFLNNLKEFKRIPALPRMPQNVSQTLRERW